MRCLISTNSNPYFNLATEEYFLKSSREEIFMLYINEPCVVVGKHQNLLSEINLDYIRKNNIKLARRISGGGTVYQDFNNLNFSFIHNCENRDQINFSKFTLPILEALNEMGIDAKLSGRNDLLINSEKISGNAMHIYKTRVLAHGTLLFDTDLIKLSSALKNNGDRYTDKSIKSVRSKVTNISDHLKNSITTDQFSKELFQNIINTKDTRIKTLDQDEINEISSNSKEKFETWNWIYGYSPKYIFKNIFHIRNISISVELSIEKGIIGIAKILTDPVDLTIELEFENVLTGTQHDYDIIKEKIKVMPKINSDATMLLSEYCDHLF